MSLTSQSLNIEQLTSQTAQLVGLLETFLDTLQSESSALKSNNPDDINQILPIKEKLSEEVGQVTVQIEKSLSPHDLSLSELLSIERPFKLAPASEKNIQTIIELSQKCNDLNTANGIAIQILNNINQQTIQIISGQEQSNVKLYDAKGESSASGKNKQTLGKA